MAHGPRKKPLNFGGNSGSVYFRVRVSGLRLSGAPIYSAREMCYRCLFINSNKLCGKPRNMPPPLYAARCSPAPAHTRLTPAAPSAPCDMNIHDQRSWCRPYKSCSDLNSQPKPSGDLDLRPFDLESGVLVTCDVGYLCANFSLPRPLCSRVIPDIRDRQTSDRQMSVKKHRLMPPLIRGGE